MSLTGSKFEELDFFSFSFFNIELLARINFIDSIGISVLPKITPAIRVRRRAAAEAAAVETERTYLAREQGL